jgi:hypothetical protein
MESSFTKASSFAKATKDTSEDRLNYNAIEKSLIDDCKIELKKRLAKYKANDVFMPQDMDNILGVINFITNGSENSIDYIHCTKDDEQNGFFQYILEKLDLHNLQWFIAKGNIKHHTEKEFSNFVAFCTEKLSPTIEQEKRNIAYTMLKSIIEHYKTNNGFQACKEYYLQVMIMLQLQHRALATKFFIEEELLTPFLPLYELCHLYQITIDEHDNTGNTLAHIIVGQYDADELHKLMKKNYISKDAKNKNGKTVYDVAFEKFRDFTQDPTLIEDRKKDAQAARCCYFMLTKYFAENQKDFEKEKGCECHIITKRYGTESDISRSSSSSQENTSSSSSQDMIINSASPNPFFKQLPTIQLSSSDEESTFAAHCPRLYNCFYPKPTTEDKVIKELTSK